jgi:hypothetical protein
MQIAWYAGKSVSEHGVEEVGTEKAGWEKHLRGQKGAPVLDKIVVGHEFKVGNTFYCFFQDMDLAKDWLNGHMFAPASPR